jgi:AcrR family transcriptional regulator
MTTKRNRNYKRAEKAIIDSLIKISKNKTSLSDISVTELCEVANISRSTFYLHYNDIENIFESVGDVFLDTFITMIEKLATEDVDDFSKYIDEVFNFIDNSNELIKIGLKLGGSFSYYVNQIKRILESLVSKVPILTNTKMNKEHLMIEIQIVSSGIIDLFIDLLKNNNTYNSSTYTTAINNFLNRWVSSLKNNGLELHN